MRKGTLLAAVLATAAAGGPAASLELDEFVTGWPIELPAGNGVFDLPLTHELYRYAGSIDRMAVLDRNGEPMPFYRAGLERESADETRVVLGASPLYAVGSGGDTGITVTSGGAGATVTLSRPPAGQSAEIIGFVVDAREVEQAPVAIELDWPDLDRPFLFDAAVEHSTDLTRWRTVGRGAVAAMSIDGTDTRHARIAIAGERGGYYRIGVEPSVPEWRLRGAALVLGDDAAEAAPRLRLVLAPAEHAGPAEHEVLFDAGGRLPVGALTLAFDGSSGWADARVAAGDSAEGPWRPLVRERLFYEVEIDGREIASPPVEIGRVEARWFRVSFTSPPPALRLALDYPVEHLRFSADGEPPYMLAGGTLRSEAGPDPTFAAVWPELAGEGATAMEAALGERTVLGGEAALVPPFELPLRTLSLWAVLAAGVACVAFMAWRLARDMARGV